MIPVIVWPGLERRSRRPTGARAPRRRGAPHLAHGRELPPARRQPSSSPAGSPYGDYLRCGAIARFSPVLRAVEAFAAEGGLVLGICNGFQILSEAGLLPGVLRPNASLSFVCRDVRLNVEQTDTPFTSRCVDGQELTIPVKHGDGCWFADDELLGELDANGQTRAPLRGRREPERSHCRRGRRHQRRRQRVRTDAASGARGRSAARLGRRGADPRFPGRRCSIVTRGRRLGALQVEAFAERLGEPGFFASSLRRRATSRGRKVTGPRRVVPSVE